MSDILLKDIYKVLGWQEGTARDVLIEIKRLKKIENCDGCWYNVEPKKELKVWYDNKCFSCKRSKKDNYLKRT